MGKSKSVRVISMLMILTVFVSGVGIHVSAESVSVGGTGYVNLQNYCDEGADSYSETSEKAYLYEELDGTRMYMRMLYLSETNKGEPKRDDSGLPMWLYCVEYGTDIFSYIERTAEGPDNSPYWNTMSAGQREGIMLATTYGFPNSNLGMSAADAYAATQALIWEFQTGIRSSATADVKKAVNYKNTYLDENTMTDILIYRSSGVEKRGMTAYRNLVAKVYSHSKMPSFASEEVLLKYDKSDKLYKATLTDKNGVLTGYDVSCANSALTVSATGNSLYISSPSLVSKVKISFTKRIPSVSPQNLVVMSPSTDGQVTVLGNAAPAVTGSIFVTADFTSKTQQISVYKKGEILKGFTNGDVHTPVYEMGYLDGCIVDVYAAKDIVNTDGTVLVSADELVDTVVTDKSGPVKTKPLYDGEYYLRERTAPEGYIIASADAPVSLHDDSELVLENSRIKYSLEFSKIMLDGGKISEGQSELLKQVSFGVYNLEPIGDLPADSLLEIIRVSDDGKFKMNVDLPYGYEYYVKELTTASGYTLSTEKYPLVPVMDGDEPCLSENGTQRMFVNAGEAVPNEMIPVSIEKPRVGLSGGTPVDYTKPTPKTYDTLSENLNIYLATGLCSVFALAIIRKKL